MLVCMVLSSAGASINLIDRFVGQGAMAEADLSQLTTPTHFHE
jgi:hypothetical protein